VNFPLTPDGWHIDVDHTLDILKSFDPRVLIMGKSLFLFPEPVKEIAPHCKKKGIHLIYDAAHVLGLIAGGQFQDPLAEGADIVTASTHKTFYGSQRGVILSNLDDEEWRKIDKGAFPGSSSNHHLETLVALSFATYEMLEFGSDYARQVITNAKQLARQLFDLGFEVQGEKFGFTETHQVALDVTGLGGGESVARNLKDNRIIVNMNLLPFEPLDHATNPSGIRLGVQEMTRVGMRESEMERIAELFKRCLIEKKFVGDEVMEFRKDFQNVGYSFDAEPL
jgi:glycine hydroxymethyltransferase